MGRYASFGTNLHGERPSTADGEMKMRMHACMHASNPDPDDWTPKETSSHLLVWGRTDSQVVNIM